MGTKDINIDSAIEFIEEQKIPAFYRQKWGSMFVPIVIMMLTVLFWTKEDLTVVLKILSIIISGMSIIFGINIIKSRESLYISLATAGLIVQGILLFAVCYEQVDRALDGAKGILLSNSIFVAALIIGIISTVLYLKKMNNWLKGLGDKPRKYETYLDKSTWISLGPIGGLIGYMVSHRGGPDEQKFLIFALCVFVICAVPFFVKEVIDNCYRYCLIKKYKLEVNLRYDDDLSVY